MKKDIAEYLIDSFVDFKGEEHKIVACALSQSPENNENNKFVIGWECDNKICHNDRDYSEIYRVVAIGISICHPNDTFNEQQGKLNAYNKALNDPKCSTIYTKTKGAINKNLVKVFLEQEIKFLKENPEKIIKGYNYEKARFDKKQNLKNKIKNLTDKEKLVAEILIKENIDINKINILLKESKQAGINISE